MRECWWLSRKLDNFNIQNYSNEDDFPYAFAKKVFRLPLIGFTIMWIVFLSESREVYMCVNILMAMFMVFFLPDSPSQQSHTLSFGERGTGMYGKGMP